MTIKKHEQADEDIRYIPDEILEARKAELLSLDDPKTRKLLGWEWLIASVQRKLIDFSFFVSQN